MEGPDATLRIDVFKYASQVSNCHTHTHKTLHTIDSTHCRALRAHTRILYLTQRKPNLNLRQARTTTERYLNASSYNIMVRSESVTLRSESIALSSLTKTREYDSYVKYCTHATPPTGKSAQKQEFQLTTPKRKLSQRANLVPLAEEAGRLEIDTIYTHVVCWLKKRHVIPAR